MSSWPRIAILALVVPVTPVGAQTTTPATSTIATDPARLAEARIMVAKLLPPGAYRTVMGAAMEPVLGNMGDTLKALPLRRMAEMGGLDAAQAAALDKIDLERVMTIYDPQWRERSQVTMRAMFDALGDFFTTMEPELREAYAHAYASRYTLAELRELNAFYATPTGSKFANQYLTMATDPAIAAEMRAMMPKLMEQLPTLVAAAKKATDSMPPPRKLTDLSAAEKAQLANALGVPESQLQEPKDGR